MIELLTGYDKPNEKKNFSRERRGRERRGGEGRGKMTAAFRFKLSKINGRTGVSGQRW